MRAFVVSSVRGKIYGEVVSFKTLKLYDITMLPATEGWGNTIVQPQRAEAGATVTITALSFMPSYFKQWEVVNGGITLANPVSTITTFIMPAENVTLKPAFEIAYALQLRATDQSRFYGGVQLIQGSYTYNVSGSITVKAIPDAASRFAKWVASNDDNAPAISTNAEYTFTITEYTTLYAVFAVKRQP